jgi:hypothetical protein
MKSLKTQLTNKKTYKEIENEKSRGKKRFLERIAETKDAEKEIKEYVPDEREFPSPEQERIE